MARDGEKGRYSLTLSHDTAARAKEQARSKGDSLSTFLAHIVEEHYHSTAQSQYEEQVNALQQECVELKAGYEKRLENLQHKYTEAERRADTEVEALTRQLQLESEKAAQSAGVQAAQIKELEDELQTAKTRTATLELEVAEKDDKLRSLEEEKQAIIAQTEEELAAKDDDIQKLEEGVPELLRRIEQERASKETVTTGLQHELERTQDRIKLLEEQVVDLKGQVLRETDEKQSLYKQLELVTLRLPAPREGFWSRVFGPRKKTE